MAVPLPRDAPISSRPPVKKPPRLVPPRPLLSDLLTELASWDSRVGRTVVARVARPGFLTKEYTAGRRVRYLSPLKMYLTVSVLFFLLLAWKNPLGSQIQVGVPPSSLPR